jgi:hypothetical protein
MTMASGRLVYATTTGTPSAVDFANGPPHRRRYRSQRPGHRRPAWQSRGLFVL